MNLDEIKKLVRLVEKSDISEIEIEEDGKKIKITKPSELQPIPQVSYSPPPVPAIATPSPAPSPTVETPAESNKYRAVKSPIVGTFYRAPGEDSPPFVREGDMVEKGQTVCIIEAMKLMNEIESDVKGKIISILIDNASPVEYGEVLFRIEPV